MENDWCTCVGNDNRSGRRGLIRCDLVSCGLSSCGLTIFAEKGRKREVLLYKAQGRPDAVIEQRREHDCKGCRMEGKEEEKSRNNNISIELGLVVIAGGEGKVDVHESEGLE